MHFLLQFLFILFGCFSPQAHNFLHSAPPLIEKKEIEQIILTLPLEMNWRGKNPVNGNDWHFRCSYKEGKAIFSLLFFNTLPSTLSSKDRQKFKKYGIDGKDVWIYSYNISTDAIAAQGVPLSLEASMGRVESPLVIREGNPKRIYLSDLYPYLDKRMIIYTGAGISCPQVPDMKTLMLKLNLYKIRKTEESLASFIHLAVQKPEEIGKTLSEFYEACLYGQPTIAHQAIKEIIKIKKCGLLTENLDLLHHRTGIKPLTHEGKNWLTTSIKPQDLKEIDMILVIGIAKDESGFLAWYKKYNPKGLILAINIQQPEYLSDDDLFLQEDVQQVLPIISEKLRSGLKE